MNIHIVSQTSPIPEAAPVISTTFLAMFSLYTNFFKYISSLKKRKGSMKVERRINDNGGNVTFSSL